MLASSAIPVCTAVVGTAYPGSTTSVGSVELNFTQDASTLAVTLVATTALAYTSAHVIMIMRWTSPLAPLSGNCGQQLLILLDLTLTGGSLRNCIRPSIGMAP